MSIRWYYPKTVPSGDRRPDYTTWYNGGMDEQEIAHGDLGKWEDWNAEKKTFPPPDSQGFTFDLKELEAHINRLTKVAPRNKNGSLHLTALRYIDSLELELHKAHRWLGPQEHAR